MLSLFSTVSLCSVWWYFAIRRSLSLSLFIFCFHHHHFFLTLLTANITLPVSSTSCSHLSSVSLFILHAMLYFATVSGFHRSLTLSRTYEENFIVYVRGRDRERDKWTKMERTEKETNYFIVIMCCENAIAPAAHFSLCTISRWNIKLVWFYRCNELCGVFILSFFYIFFFFFFFVLSVIALQFISLSIVLLLLFTVLRVGLLVTQKHTRSLSSPIVTYTQMKGKKKK